MMGGRVEPDLADELFGLQLRWDDHYYISLVAGRWFAVPKSAPYITLSAMLAYELRDRMIEDHGMRMIARQFEERARNLPPCPSMCRFAVPRGGEAA
jgi:hypothetical protein